VNVALIFARGGSKGLPKKNIKMLGGKPLIAYSIQAAKESPAIERVFVSTESHEIASISTDFGAAVIKRPVELSTDTACLSEAYLHAFQYLIDHNVSLDNVLCMMPTYPFKTSGDVTKMIELINEDDFTVVTWYNKIELPAFSHYARTEQGDYSAVDLSAGIPIDSARPQTFFLLNHSIASHASIPYPYQRRLGIPTDPDKTRCGLNVVVDKVRSVDINDRTDFELASQIIDHHSFDFESSFADLPFYSFSNR
jgi:hypothetical protein